MRKPARSIAKPTGGRAPAKPGGVPRGVPPIKAPKRQRAVSMKGCGPQPAV